ncbi:unnamed protein product [Cyprideis torosa]|uniref:Uncharacterized protein n=1 Tax=Cyprideis torosa TaxID=163714 RepID=A0A7R8WA94_9CRUS|nr:unnamed protein product [Cyprideis torosa]CAG0890722.1 unnamed protein product [Cyprideis torosa]
MRKIIKTVFQKLEGPKDCGVLLICGQTGWNETGRKSTGDRILWNPSRFSCLSGIRIRKAISGCSAAHSILITEEGKAMSFGRNEKGQLGNGTTDQVDEPTLINDLKEFTAVDAACGRNHTLVLTDHGTVWAFGDNKNGQCGIGQSHPPSVLHPSKMAFRGPRINKIACGAEFSMIVDRLGQLYSFGLPEYGQLGNNTDGKYFVTSTKLGHQCVYKPIPISCFVEKSRDGVQPVHGVCIVDVACGNNHTIAMDSRGRVFSWGFGGYGRLGHSETKDEKVPRLIKFFDGPNRGASMIFAGSSFSLAFVQGLGGLYLWGQNNKAGEANMYPKPIQDLCGWAVHSLGCGNTSVVVAADDSVISFGPAPAYGELCYGENCKSSRKPKEVTLLDSVRVLRVACGYSHSMFIVRDDTDDDKKELEKFHLFSPSSS